MNIMNEMKVEFLSKSSNESFARAVSSAFIAQLDPTIEEMSDVKTAVSEAVTNAIIHGYRHSIGVITMMIRIFEERIIEITIADRGVGIADIEEARQPLFTTCDGEERSGMGFTVMETFMDQVEVISAVSEGTKVIMQKALEKDA